MHYCKMYLKLQIFEEVYIFQTHTNYNLTIWNYASLIKGLEKIRILWKYYTTFFRVGERIIFVLYTCHK
jgi:hypothetical protein